MASSHTPTEVRVVPLIEFDPFEYRASERKQPDLALDEAPEDWSRFWQGAIADAGIRDLEPWPGTWVVPVRQILRRDDAKEVLGKVMAVHFTESGPAVFLATLPGPFDPKSGMNADGESVEEHFTALRGGLGLRSGDDVATAIAPECCGDLSNWRSWFDATQLETGNWSDVWIGHPSAKARREGDVLLVQKVLESGEEEGLPLTLPPTDLHAATEAARAQLEELAQEIVPILTGAAIDALLAERMARKLAGLAEYELD